MAIVRDFLTEPRLARLLSVRKFILMTISNMSAYTANHDILSGLGLISLLLSNIKQFDCATECEEILQYATTAITNRARNLDLHSLLMNLQAAHTLVLSITSAPFDWNAVFMALTNLASNYHYRLKLMSSGCLNRIYEYCVTSTKSGKVLMSPAYMQGLSLLFYNLSCHFDSYLFFLNETVITSIIAMIKNKEDKKCRQYAIMALANVASYCYEDAFDIRSKILKAIISFLKHSTTTNDQRLALIALCNISNSPIMQEQLTIHGLLSLLTFNDGQLEISLIPITDKRTITYATLLMANMAGCESNRATLLSKGVYTFLQQEVKSEYNYIREYTALAIANLSNTTDNKITSYVCQNKGIPIINQLTLEYHSVSSIFLAVASINKMIDHEPNRSYINDSGIFDCVSYLGFLPY